MRLGGIDYSIKHEAILIYLTGCIGTCKNCHNPHMKDFDVGDDLTKDKIDDIIESIKRLDCIRNIWIVGGDPLDQNIDELEDFLRTLKQQTKKAVWLFTRFTLKDIDNKILKQIDYVKIGAYIEELETDNNIHYGIKLATSNQRIINILKVGW